MTLGQLQQRRRIVLTLFYGLTVACGLLGALVGLTAIDHLIRLIVKE